MPLSLCSLLAVNNSKIDCYNLCQSILHGKTKFDRFFVVFSLSPIFGTSSLTWLWQRHVVIVTIIIAHGSDQAITVHILHPPHGVNFGGPGTPVHRNHVTRQHHATIAAFAARRRPIQQGHGRPDRGTKLTRDANQRQPCLGIAPSH